MTRYLAIVSADDPDVTPILIGPEGIRMAYLFADEALAEDFAKHQDKIANWRIKEIPAKSILQWVADRREIDKATRVAHQLAVGVDRQDTIEGFLTHLAIQEYRAQAGLDRE